MFIKYNYHFNKNVFVILFIVIHISGNEQANCDCPPPASDILNKSQIVIPNQYIDSKCELTYKFEVPDSVTNDENTKIRIHVETTNATDLDCPIIFIIYQREQTFKIEIPTKNLQFQNASTFYRGGKTLCKPRVDVKRSNISIHVNTCSAKKLQFNLTIDLIRDLVLEYGGNKTFALGVLTPQYFIYRPSKNSTSAIINLLSTSDTDICLTVSIQTPFCPIYDDIFDIEYSEGFYKTMTRSTVVTIDTSLPSFTKGFAVVYAIHEDTSFCFDDKPHYIPYTAHKLVTIRILQEENFPWLYFLLCPVIFCAIVFLMVFLGYMSHCRIIRELKPSDGEFPVNGNQNSAQEIQIGTNRDHTFRNPTIVDGRIENSSQELGNSIRHPSDEIENRIRNPIISETETNSGMLPNPDDVIVIVQPKVNIMLSDFVIENQAGHNNQFWQLLFLFGFYYASPVIQLVIILLMTLEKDGNYDTCFYNELCSAQWWIFHDFNHFYSNISYLLFGLLSIGIIILRENAHHRGDYSILGVDDNDEVDIQRGIPRQYHLLLSLAIAFIGECFLSAVYHLCPNKFTFQYDTSFMYVISIFTLLHLFMARQPITFRPFMAFFYILPFVAVTTIAYIVDQADDDIAYGIFLGLYGLVYFVSFAAFSIFYHDLGLLKEHGKVNETSKIIKLRLKHLFGIERQEHLRIIKNKLVLPSVILIASSAIHTYYSGKSLTSQFLYVLVAATMLSVFHYTVQKAVYDRKKQKFVTLVFPLLCFVFAGIIGGVGMSEFLHTSYDANDSPAQSRAKNQPCEFLHYDHHDVWHMLSSASLFLTLMGLLTVDDGMDTTRRSEITSF